MTGQGAGVPTVRLEVPDYDQGLRGKSVRADKLADGGKAAMCTILYGLSIADDVTDTPLASAANGYPDALAIPDESTRVHLPWKRSTEAVIADMFHQDGTPVLESPRTVLRNLVGGFAELDLEPILGFEYEVYISHADDLAAGIRAFGRTDNAYSLLRLSEAEELAEEFMARMEVLGIPIEAFHSELGPGFFEFAMSPAPALQAADRAARARQYFRELCAERGLRATFMAKLHIEHSGSGGHVHQSIMRSGVNVFAKSDGSLSDQGQQYIAGLLATMGEFTVLFNPFMNSFKRLSASFFVATRATWGFDNRNAACRVILTTPPSGARVEHRRPGADVSPYLAAMGMVAGGLHGLREKLNLGAPLAVDSDISTSGEELPITLDAAVQSFETSATASALLGPEFVASYAATRRGEIAAFDRWWRESITDWELRRYVEHL
jgi:glutamine synthetase